MRASLTPAVNFINVERTQVRPNTAWGIHYTEPGGFTGHVMLLIMLLMYTTAHYKCVQVTCKVQLIAQDPAAVLRGVLVHAPPRLLLHARPLHARDGLLRPRRAARAERRVHRVRDVAIHHLGRDPLLPRAHRARHPVAAADAACRRADASVGRDGAALPQAVVQVSSRHVAVPQRAGRLGLAVAPVHHLLGAGRPVRVGAHPPGGRLDDRARRAARLHARAGAGADGCGAGRDGQGEDARRRAVVHGRDQRRALAPRHPRRRSVRRAGRGRLQQRGRHPDRYRHRRHPVREHPQEHIVRGRVPGRRT